MTAMSFRKKPPYRNMIRAVRQNLKMTIVTCILEFLGIPLIVGGLLSMLILQTHPDMTDTNSLAGTATIMYTVIGFVCLAAALFMGMIAGINSFTETHNKSKVDMLYSLPLTGTQRFFSDYVGGLCMYVVPYIGAMVIGWIEFLILPRFVAWGTAEVDGMTYETFMSQTTKVYAYLSLGILALMLLYYTLSVLITCCCGTLFESIYTNVLLNALLPGCLAAVIAVITSALDFSFAHNWQIIGFTSPIGGLIYLIYIVLVRGGSGGEFDLFSTTSGDEIIASETTAHAVFPAFMRWIVIILLLGTALLLLAWQLYIRRKAEMVGQPFVWKGVYFVMLTLITVSILCLLYSGIAGPVILFAAIVYLIMEAIRKRGFRRFWLSALSFGGTVVACVGLYYLITETGCFGRENFVPSPAAVSSVLVECDGGNGGGFCLEYKDKDVIEKITQMHRDLLSAREDETPWLALDRKMEKEGWNVLAFEDIFVRSDGSEWGYESYDPSYPEDGEITTDFDPELGRDVYAYTSTNFLELTYYTLSGGQVYREYVVTPDQAQAVQDIVAGTELYGDGYVNLLREGLERTITSIEEYSWYDDNFSDSGYYLVKYIPEREAMMPAYTSYEAPHVITFPQKGARDLMEEFLAAYEKDAALFTPELLCTGKRLGELEIERFSKEFPVYENFEATIAFLEKHGIEVETGEEVEEKFGLQDVMQDYSIEGGENVFLEVRIYKPDTYRAASEVYPHSTLTDIYVKPDSEEVPAYRDMYYNYDGSRMKDTYPELEALLQAVRSNYVTTENCYAVMVNGRNYLLPESESELAEAVLKKGSLWWRDKGAADYFKAYWKEKYPDQNFDDYDFRGYLPGDFAPGSFDYGFYDAYGDYHDPFYEDGDTENGTDGTETETLPEKDYTSGGEPQAA